MRLFLLFVFLILILSVDANLENFNIGSILSAFFERLYGMVQRLLQRPHIDFLHLVDGTTPRYQAASSSKNKFLEEENLKRSFFYSEYCEREIEAQFPDEGESEVHIPIPFPFGSPEIAIIPHDFTMLTLSLNDFYAKSSILNYDFSFLESFYDVKFERNKPFRISLGGIHSDSVIYFRILTPFSTSSITLKACIFDLKLNFNLHLDSSPFSSKWLLDDVDVVAESLSYQIEAGNFVEQYFLDFITNYYIEEIRENLLMYLNRKISRLVYMNLYSFSCVFSLQELLRRTKLLFTFLLTEYIPRRFALRVRNSK